ncbi:NmrA/HSCARG family protein [Pleomorphomonas oryzae]|uniref:NmrA/HSCARG family protein n=1 Tax=Pleomorphomonas oryzae TaxID=261934 RepID=UPI0004255F65|nr:NmrA/HSCARG family protein [Pleomorphomonas oryzae]
MNQTNRTILVFGATGQQGGSAAAALLKAGWRVRALVRNPASPKAVALSEAGAELVRGDFADTASLRAAMAGAHGVFSVQPSSGQGPELGLTDEEELRYGTLIADLAVETGVQHLVYSSTGAVGDMPTGVGHFDMKARIEAHIRTLPVTATILRPAAFMDMLLMPGFGLSEGRFTFFVRPDQAMQLIAVEDIGKFVALAFADPTRFGGATLEIASDEVTGADLEAAFSEVAGRPIPYQRFSDETLTANPFLAKLTALFDAGRLTGKADLVALRQLVPDLRPFPAWLATTGRAPFEAAQKTGGAWAYGN